MTQFWRDAVVRGLLDVGRALSEPSIARLAAHMEHAAGRQAREIARLELLLHRQAHDLSQAVLERDERIGVLIRDRDRLHAIARSALIR